MKLYHATPLEKVESILKSGLRLSQLSTDERIEYSSASLFACMYIADAVRISYALSFRYFGKEQPDYSIIEFELEGNLVEDDQQSKDFNG